MFEEVLPAQPDAEPYASVEELLLQDDLVERDVTIRRWHRNGKALKLRLKALNLEQQDSIHQAAQTKNKKTDTWEAHHPTFCAHTLMHLVRIPALDLAQAQALTKKNPSVINAIVNFGWSLSAFTAEDLEAAALALTPTADSDTQGA